MITKKYQDIIAKILLDIECVRFSFEKPFILSSGKKSPVYVDCRKIISFVNERNIILDYAKQYFELNKLNFEILAGGETAGIPYAAFLSEQMQKKMIYIRKKPKGFGKNNQIEGDYKKGQKTILIEDLATDGGSKVIFINALREANLIVKDIFVIFYYDIFNLSETQLGKLNVKIHSLCTWKNIFNILLLEQNISEEKIENLKIFLNEPEKWREQYG